MRFRILVVPILVLVVGTSYSQINIQWESRLNVLKSQIEYWSNEENKTEKTIEVIQIFYDGFK